MYILSFKLCLDCVHFKYLDVITTNEFEKSVNYL